MTRAKTGLASAWRKFELRAYRVAESSPLVGLTVAAAEARVPDRRLFIHRLRRGERVIEAEPGATLEAGDVIGLSGPRQFIVGQIGPSAEEVEDKELLDVPITTADVLLTNSKLAGMNLGDASREDWARGLYLRWVRRGSQDIPIAAGVELQRGDLLRIVGPEPIVERAAAKIGADVDPRASIDFVVLGLAIFLGGGRWRSRRLFRGRRQNLAEHQRRHAACRACGWVSSQSLSTVRANSRRLDRPYDVAGANGVRGAYRDPCGADLPLSFEGGRDGASVRGMVVTLLPQAVGLFFGHFVLRMNPILLLGALAGGQTVTAAMAAIQERSGSPVAVLGYAPAYPVANILLTTWGTIVVEVMAG